MRPDLGQLQIERLIVHEVPQRRASQETDELLLSEVESQLNQSLKNYFRERTSGSLNSAAADVMFDKDSTSPVPLLIATCLEDGSADFVEASRQVARHLYNTQTAVNPPGLLVMAQAVLAGTRSIAILKLERESGVRARQTNIEGKMTFDIEHIRELMLTERTRVFKVGLFWGSLDESDAAEGIVCDKQRGPAVSREVAGFFLQKFLGCRLRTEPDIQTRQFFRAAQEFINKGVSNPQEKARYQIALLAEMNSGRTEIDPRQFAETHLDLSDRMPFQRSITDSGLPITSFTKDTSLIQSVLKRVQIDFEIGIAVLGPPDSFDQHVKMTNTNGGRTRLEIEDTISEVKGKR